MLFPRLNMLSGINSQLIEAARRRVAQGPNRSDKDKVKRYRVKMLVHNSIADDSCAKPTWIRWSCG